MADHYQVLLDVKLDLKERKHELWQLRVSSFNLNLLCNYLFDLGFG